MELKFIKKHKQWVIACVIVIVALSNAQVFVHCQSEDGHSDIELVDSNCCTVSSDMSSEDLTAFFEKKFSIIPKDCGPCVDTPISNHFFNTTQKTDQLTYVITPTPLIINQIVLFESLVSGLNSDNSAFVNTSLPYICTVILLV